MNMKREVWIDWLRIVACLFVMMTHCCECFYFGDGGTLVMTKADAVWVTLLNTFTRACVPLFVVASSYLQFPIHYSTGEFFRRRIVRVIVPFLIWSLVYAFVWGEPVQNLKDLALNFNYSAGHLWFVYMLLGVYLIMPLLSPWAEKVGKKELLLFLGIWLFSTLIPFIRQWAGGPAQVIYGPSGIPNLAKYPLWGEASWNSYGTFYYISGFIGYLLLGLYFRKFVKQLSWEKDPRHCASPFRGRILHRRPRILQACMGRCRRYLPRFRAAGICGQLGNHLVQRHAGPGPDDHRLDTGAPEVQLCRAGLPKSHPAGIQGKLRYVSLPYAGTKHRPDLDLRPA